MTPLYKHDCTKCIFLANYNNHDLYFCATETGRTVIARYGNLGSEYKSGFALAGKDEELAIALTIIKVRLSKEATK